MMADTAKVWVYLPADRKATGRSIVICPGGGYTNLAMSHEGHEWAKFFQNMGITAVVLKYRMPNGNPEVPISDAEEAIRLVRRNAMQWHVKSNEVGIMGSSAGGHLASIVATKSERTAKPNFQILFYCTLLNYIHRILFVIILNDILTQRNYFFCNYWHR